MLDDILFDTDNLEVELGAFASAGSAQIIVYTDGSVKNNITAPLNENKVIVIL
jgi:hypothetical protein